MNDEERKDEDYAPLEKIGIVFLWYMGYMFDTGLRKEGYYKKYRSKVIYTIIGVVLYALIIITATLSRQHK